MEPKKIEGTKPEVKSYNLESLEKFDATISQIRNWTNLIEFLNTVGNYWMHSAEKDMPTFGLRGELSRDTTSTCIKPGSFKVTVSRISANGNTLVNDNTIPYGRDYNFLLEFYCTILAKNVDSGKIVSEWKYHLGTIKVYRMINCCGMAVLTDLATYIRSRPSSKSSVGTLITLIAEIVALKQRYSSTIITNRVKDSKLEVLVDKLGYAINLKWTNSRTQYELFSASKDLGESKKYIYSTLQYLIKGKDTIRTDFSDIYLDEEVAGLIQKKTGTLIEKKKKNTL